MMERRMRLGRTKSTLARRQRGQRVGLDDTNPTNYFGLVLVCASHHHRRVCSLFMNNKGFAGRPLFALTDPLLLLRSRDKNWRRSLTNILNPPDLHNPRSHCKILKFNILNILNISNPLDLPNPGSHCKISKFESIKYIKSIQ